MSSYPKTTYGRKSKDVDEACVINQPKQNDITDNIIIYTLVGLCIFLFIVISIGFFVIAKPLNASLASVALRNLTYNDTFSSSPYFNATLAMVLRINNPNPGFFEFPTSKGDILYNGRRVGEMEINGQRIASYTNIRTVVTTQVRYKENQAPSVWFKNDVERGLIILKIEVKLKGEVHMEALNKRTVNLECLMHLNLREEVIQRFWCK